jgi:hypothetical protein
MIEFAKDAQKKPRATECSEAGQRLASSRRRVTAITAFRAQHEGDHDLKRATRQFAEHRRSADVGHRVPYRIPQMRASHLALIVAVLAIPSAAYSQESGQVDGRVGPDLNTSLMQPHPSPGSMGPYHCPAESGLRAGGGIVMPGSAPPSSMDTV